MIPVFRPSYGEEEIQAIRKVLESGWTGMGPKVEQFEEEFARYIGVKYAVAMSSGTAALHLAMKCLFEDQRMVVTTPFTFISTNHAILYNGRTPWFCDIDYHTLNLDVSKISQTGLELSQGIVCVHFSGHACDMETIADLAARYNLKVIEDVAHGCGGEYKDKKLGSFGNVGCFSFHAVKNLSCGEGGMAITNDKDICERMKRLRWLGINKSTWERSNGRYEWDYSVSEIGFKYTMSDIAAAIGLVQLKKLDKLNARRRELAKRYTEAFYSGDAAIAPPWVVTPIERPEIKSAWHSYVIKSDARDKLHEYLKENGVATSVHYKPNYYYPMYQAHCPNAELAWQRVLTLPLYPDLKEEEQDKIIALIKGFKTNAR